MKPIVGPLFDRAWRKACSVKPCSVKDVDKFIRAHYLAKRPAIVLLALVMLHKSRPVGCVIYSAPPRECDKRYGGKTWELARLYLLDDVPQNAETWLIAQSVKWIKRNRPEVCTLVSHADPSAGHSGTIYRAANWREDGRTDDERKTPRCDYYDARTGKKYGRRGNMPADAVVERRPRVSKHRFALAIRRPNKLVGANNEAYAKNVATVADAASGGGGPDFAKLERGKRTGQSVSPSLATAVALENRERFPTPRTTPRGCKQLGGAETGPLNPTFREWLMGWPIDWTARRQLETDKYREWWRSHGTCCVENQVDDQHEK